MVSLYKRSSPSQRRMLRIVEGAVKNALDAHPRASVPHNFARSVAKRATGTLSAQLPEVLAAKKPSSRDRAQLTKPRSRVGSPAKPIERAAPHVWEARPAGFRELHKRLGLMAGWARKAGHDGRAAAFADALRVVASVEAELGR
jgi:hypothetical protein